MAASSKSRTNGDENESSTKKSQHGHGSTTTATNGVITDEEDYGYYFFPDREGKKERGFFHRFIFQGDRNHFKCGVNVKSCMQSNPMVKLLMGALKSYGCPVNIDRHISCEPCLQSVSGGFDPNNMQVVICENNAKKKEVCCNVLAHELLHAFDYCRAKVDFQNLRHLACTEIRAANMNHCSLAAAFASGELSAFDFRQKHEYCVKNKALQSVMLVRNVSEFEAMTVIDDVFDKCYNDTEPYGRRCFKDAWRAKRAFDESRNYYDYD